MEKYNPFEIALDKTYGEFPKLKKPFELDSNGLFFLSVLVNKITRNLVDFYNKYEELLVKRPELPKLNIKDFLLAKQKIYSLPGLMDVSEDDISGYLNTICEKRGISDNAKYMHGDIEDRLRYISVFLMTDEGIYPLRDYFLFEGERKIPTREDYQTLIKSLIFEVITLLHYTIDDKNPMSNEYFTETLIALTKIQIIFTINEKF